MRAPIADDIAGKCVCVVVVMLIDAEAGGGFRAEQPHIFGVPRNRGGPALAADMPVEADHTVTCAEHHMQIVGDKENAAAAIVSDRRDQLVELAAPREVHRLRGLVQHQQLRIAGKRARKQNALKFAAGQFAQLRIDDAFRACFSRQAAARSRGTASLSDMKRRTESGMMRSTGKRCGT